MVTKILFEAVVQRPHFVFGRILTKSYNRKTLLLALPLSKC